MVVVELALAGFSGTDQFQVCSVRLLGVFGVNAKLIIPFELTLSSVLVQLTVIDGLLYPVPAPGELLKSGKAAVGQIFEVEATVSAQLWLPPVKRTAISALNTANGRNFFIGQ